VLEARLGGEHGRAGVGPDESNECGVDPGVGLARQPGALIGRDLGGELDERDESTTVPVSATRVAGRVIVQPAR
jgi:hypothetical protein